MEAIEFHWREPEPGPGRKSGSFKVTAGTHEECMRVGIKEITKSGMALAELKSVPPNERAGSSEVTPITNEKMERVVQNVVDKMRRYQCGQRTAWVQWMTEEERGGYSYTEVNMQLRAFAERLSK